jgi:hypothetical protein
MQQAHCRCASKYSICWKGHSRPFTFHTLDSHTCSLTSRQNWCQNNLLHSMINPLSMGFLPFPCKEPHIQIFRKFLPPGIFWFLEFLGSSWQSSELTKLGQFYKLSTSPKEYMSHHSSLGLRERESTTHLWSFRSISMLALD